MYENYMKMSPCSIKSNNRTFHNFMDCLASKQERMDTHYF